jgi:hypothetical protein
MPIKIRRRGTLWENYCSWAWAIWLTSSIAQANAADLAKAILSAGDEDERDRKRRPAGHSRITLNPLPSAEGHKKPLTGGSAIFLAIGQKAIISK